MMDQRNAIQKHLAKLTPPQLHGVLVRDRLYRELDRATESPAVWISAPGGSGKTILISSYLADRHLKPLWYRVDEGDRDIASFFYYLGIAANEIAPGLQADLPKLTMEYQQGLPTFARRFFRELFSSMGKPGVIVFDNYQDVGKGALLHDVLQLCFNEITEGITVFVVSRYEPPPQFTRLRTTGALKVLESETIQFNKTEVAQLYQKRTGHLPDNELVEYLYQRTKGWATGLVLLMEHGSDINHKQNRSPAQDTEVFDYFAGEILERAEGELQQFLLKTSFLPKFSPSMAAELTNAKNPAAILEDLVKRHYFTYRGGTNDESYEYHPLFREFLSNRAARILTKDQLRESKTRSAQLLAQSGMLNEAVELYRETASWNELAKVIIEEAPSQYASGRWISIGKWIAALPVDSVNEQPWLVFWRANAALPIDITLAREDLKNSYTLFKDAGNAVGAYLAWCASVDSYTYVWASFAGLDFWIDEAGSLRNQFPEYPSKEIEAKFVSGLMGALIWRRTDSPLLTEWAIRNEALLEEAIDDGAKLIAGYHATLYEIWLRGNIRKTKHIYERLKIVGQNEKVAIIPRLLWHITEAACCYALNDIQKSIKAAQEGISRAREVGVYNLNFLLHAQAVYAYLANGDVERASLELKLTAELMERTPTFDFAHYYYLCAWNDLDANNISDATRNISLALQEAEKSGGSLYIPFGSIGYGQVLYESGRKAEAAEMIKFAEAWGTSSGNNMIIAHCAYMRALEAMEEGDLDRCDDELRKAVEIGRDQGYTVQFWIGWRMALLAKLYLRCLESNIETIYVTNVIRIRHIEPPNDCTSEKWPFPVKIGTLGVLKVDLDGIELKFSGKTQKKPLELLKALIALGPESVASSKLCDYLWPDSDGDTAAQNLKAVIHRLRKLIGKDVVLQEGGNLSLNHDKCWVDLWAFDELLRRLNSAGNETDRQTISSYLESATGLYRGHFLADESAAPWAIGMRERVRLHWFNAIRSVARRFASEGLYKETIELYHKGLQLDELSEDLYLELMTCHAMEGDFPAALAVYERGCRILESVLGTGPSERMKTLRQAVTEKNTSLINNLCSKYLASS